MPLLYHEKQDAALCGVHCLNNLLQGRYFNEVDLAKIAHEMDESERALMLAGGMDSTDYLKYMAEDSGNVAEDGNFSVSVLSHAIERAFNLQALSITSEDMRDALDNPLKEQAFICNLQSHWLAVRKLHGSWWNLNSLEKRPQFLSDIYLGAYLKQLEIEGYNIFVIRGPLPDPVPDVTDPEWVQVNNPQGDASTGNNLSEDEELRRAIQASLSSSNQGANAEPSFENMTEEEQLEWALKQSMSPTIATQIPQPSAPMEEDDPDLAAALNLSRAISGTYQPPTPKKRKTQADLEPEPNPGPDVTIVRVRLPNGTRTERRFHKSSPLYEVYDWLSTLESVSTGIDNYKLMTSFPKTDFVEKDKPLSELGIDASTVFTLAPI